jgi:hypothetical protein
MVRSAGQQYFEAVRLKHAHFAARRRILSEMPLDKPRSSAVRPDRGASESGPPDADMVCRPCFANLHTNPKVVVEDRPVSLWWVVIALIVVVKLVHTFYDSQNTARSAFRKCMGAGGAIARAIGNRSSVGKRAAAATAAAAAANRARGTCRRATSVSKSPPGRHSRAHKRRPRLPPNRFGRVVIQRCSNR